MENRRGEKLALLAWVLFATLALAAVACYRHHLMLTSTFDLAIYDQMIWLLSAGEHPPQS